MRPIEYLHPTRSPNLDYDGCRGGAVMSVSRVLAFASVTALVLVVAGCGNSTRSGVGGTSGSGGSGGVTGAGGSNGAGGAAIDAGQDAATGCGTTGAPTGVLMSQTIMVGSRARSYVLSIPQHYDPDTPLALVFGWHGSGATGALARQESSIEPAAAGRAIFVYPDGLGAAGASGWDWTATGRDVELFDALVDHLTGTYCIDRNRIFSTGFSDGAYFTNAIGCFRGNVLRAIAPVAGGPPGTSDCVGNVGVWIAHASNDPIVDFTTGGIATRDFWIARNGCSTTVAPVQESPAECAEYQDCEPDLPVVWCVHTGRHIWPNEAECPDVGTCFDAGPAVWAFFARFH